MQFNKVEMVQKYGAVHAHVQRMRLRCPEDEG